MKKLCLLLADRYDAMLARERLMVFLALVSVLVGAFVLLVFNPALTSYQQAHRSLQQSQQMLAGLAEQEALLIESSSRDPDAEARAALASLAQALEAQRLRLLGGNADLMTPELMAGRLRELIAARKGLVLRSIQSGEAQDLLAPATTGAASAKQGLSLYRHSVKLVLQGPYAALAAYVREIEALPGQVAVSELQLRSEAWPLASLSLKLEYNSLERAWLAF